MKQHFTKFWLLLGFVAFSTLGALAAPLSGSYTIGAGTGYDYASVVSAASALASQGVSGPVTFTIADGTYSGQASFGKISGASSTNTITFIGKSKNADKVKLTNTSSYTLYFSSSAYVNFEYVTITSSYSSSYTIYMYYSSDCSIKHSKLLGTYMGAYNYYSNRITYDDCYVTGGTYGLYFYNSSSSFGEQNTVLNTQIHNTSSYGLYYYYQRDGLINKVDVDSTGYGLYSYYGNNNTITNSRFKCNYYHYVAYQNYTSAKSTDTGRVMNNQFINLGGSSYGIYGAYGQRIKWYHNSFDLKGSSYGMYWYYPLYCEIFNNNIKMEGGTYGFYMYQTPAKMDYNNLYLKGGSYFCVFGTTAYSTYSSLISGNRSYNQNSLNVDPEFELDQVDLHSYSSNLNNKGTHMNYPLIRTDFDGNVRPAAKDAPKVDIGCNDYYLPPYDLSIYALVSPQSVNLGKNKITAQFKNTGSQSITNTDVTVQYSVDSGKTWITDTLSIKSLAPGAVVQFDYTKIWKPTRSGKFRVSIKIVSSTFGTKQKDYDICSGLSGNYTIGKGPKADYPDFKSAINDLKCGVSGNIVFNVRPGTYNGQVTIGEILGASPKRTVTFRAVSIDSVTLQNNNGYTLGLVGTDYVRFENMRIEADASSGFAVWMTNAANYNKFTGCVIQADITSTSSASVALAMSSSSTSYSGYGDNGNYNEFRDCQFKGGYFTISCFGTSSTDPLVGNKFYNNTFTDGYYYGGYIYYSDSLVFVDNVSKNLRSTSGYPMNFYYPSNFDIERNYFNGGGYTYLYYANYYNYNGKARSKFINNTVISTSTSYTMYGYQMGYTDFLHNSMYGKGSYLIYWYYMHDNVIKNNIFYYEGSTYCIYTYNPTFVEWDYNDYVINGSGSILSIGGTTILSNLSALAAWNPNYNQHNYDLDPQWVDKQNDLHLTNKFPGMYGANVGVALDMDQDKRCMFSPTLGCDEFKQSALPPTANFLVPDTAWLNSPTVLLNANKPSRVASSMWFVNGKFVSDSIHLEYTPRNTGMDTIKLIMENCTGKDSITKLVYVSPILRAPKVDFSATSRDIYTDDLITLLDLSANGATQWSWDITPKVVYDPFLLIWTRTYTMQDSTVANPWIYFSYPGIYQVKLTVANVFGTDSLVKTAFIKVRQKSTMCDIPYDTDGKFGTLYDNGGEFGGYTAGLNGLNKCTYLISSCYGEVDLTVQQFDLADGDYLQVYDGADDSGRPLWDANNYPLGMNGNKTDKSVNLQFTAKSGSVYFVFESDANTSTIGKGFAIDWEMNPVSWTAPTAAISAPDTVCVGFPSVFSNASSGNYSYVEWDVNNDGKPDAEGDQLSYTFTTPGTYSIWLHAISLCAPKDSVEKKVVVENARKAAKPDFTASETVVSAGDTVRINSTSNYCASGTRWEITPANYLLTDDASLTDEFVDVIFTKGGFYTVKVVKTNPAGADSTTKVNYIQVLDYCVPTVVNLDADVAISRVAFGSIDNSSSVGKSGYSNYTNLSTNVERGYSYEITIERATTNKEMSRRVWIDWNIDGDFDDAGEMVLYEAPSTNQVFKDSITISPSAKPGKTRMRVSVNYKNLKNVACGPHQFGEFEDYTINILEKDLTPPALTLYGALNDSVEVNTSWKDAGFKAIDLVDGDITSTVAVNNTLDLTTTGTYTITYVATDKSGNSATETRTIVVYDGTAPDIKLLGDDTVYVQIYTGYNEAGTTQSDNYDKSLSPNTYSALDTANLGEYTITYCVTDASGNGPVCVSRLVIVQDTIKPMISLIGNDKEVVEVFSFYNDAGYNVVENDQYTVKMSGNWDGVPDTLGTYRLVYTVMDRAGNSASVSREIEVVDTKEPVLTLNGNAIDTIARWDETYTDAGVTVSDNYYSAAEVNVVKGGTYKDAQSEGVFTITYEATDPSNNVSATVTRLVVVMEDGTGISEVAGNGFIVYPNPSNGGFNVATSLGNGQVVQLRVLDLTGREIYNAGNFVVSNGQFKLDLSSLANGTYYLQMANNNSQTIEKILIAK
ncbi:DUF5011 domain-containing protein [bacterium]|nr:DUF5011 domain-containing protein [bacterium]